MAPWLRFLEGYLIQLLLRTPAFHRGVEKVAHRVHRYRNGLPPEPRGGTSMEDPANNSNFFKHFSEEVQTQLGRAERLNEREQVGNNVRRAVPDEGENSDAAWRASREDSARREVRGKKVGESGYERGEDADVAWREAGKRGYEEGTGPGPKQGFLGEYVAALREQMRSGK